MSAIRLARGFTGRDVVVKFAGCYHGHVDSLLASAGSGLATFAAPGTPGVPESSTALTLVLFHNDRAAVEQAFAEHGDRIACLITEAAPGNARRRPARGRVQPLPGRHLPSPRGAVHQRRGDDRLPCDPSGPVGLDGAVEGWRPDLVTFGKVMAGLPAAASGGRADVMSQLAPEGPVYQAGTLSGNPVATTAGLTTLRLATDEVHEHVGRPPRRSGPPRPTPCGHAGVAHVVQATGTMFPVFLTATAVRDSRAPRARPDGVRRVLPRHAGPRCSPAAVGVRGVVPVLGARRPCRADRRRRPAPCPAPRPPPRRSREPDARHRRPPAAPREVHNPDGVLYGRRDGFHLSDPGARWPRRWPTRSRTATSRTPVVVAAGAGVGDRGDRSRQSARPGDHHRRPVIESTNVFERASASAGGENALRKPATRRYLWNPFKPPWASPKARGEPDDGGGARRPRGGHRPRGRHRVAPAADLDHPPARGGPVVPPRPAPPAQCTLCSLTFHFVGDRITQVSYPSPRAT